ncbi:MAG: HEAT repeat domain-containing protein [Anaerolineae bacterium]|nr:HEAT repeat domain-containing protein [Anaerolineae bacterium]
MSIESYLKQLKSTDANQRKAAIVALGKSGDPRALKPLAHIHKNDPDPALRELALRAGRYIQKQASQSAASVAAAASAPPPPAPSESANFWDVASSGSLSTSSPPVPSWVQDEGRTQLPSAKPVTDRDRQKARSLVDQALNLKVAGQTDKMLDSLAKAIALDPKLEDDYQVLSLLTIGLGVSSDRALEALEEYQKRPAHQT